MIVANVGFGVLPLRVDADGSASGRFLPGPAAFIEARPADAPPPLPAPDSIDLTLHQTPNGTRPTELMGDAFDPEFGFAVSVCLPGLFTVWSDTKDWYAAVDGATRSWARVNRDTGGHATVSSGGARRLWDEMETIHAVGGRRSASPRPARPDRRPGRRPHPVGGRTRRPFVDARRVIEPRPVV